MARKPFSTSPNQRLLWQILHHLRAQQRTPKGFTLLELMVTMIIGSIIIGSLLWLVVELVGTDQREYALSETQRDMQRTLDYITADMREAVYIYDGSCNLEDETAPTNTTDNSCPSYANYISSNNLQGIPVLAFWKTDPVDSVTLATAPFNNCNNLTGTKINECQGLLRKRHFYTLVVYTQDTATGNEWEGKSRIYRYELPKYKTLSTLTRNQGYVDPSEAGTGVFQHWPFADGTDLQTCTTDCPDGVAQVLGRPDNINDRAALTDFVDDFLPSDQVDVLDTDGDGNVESAEVCDSGYQLTPRDAATGHALSVSFYACVKSGNEDRDNDGSLDTAAGLAEDFNVNNSLETTNSISANQDAIIYLRGNANGRGNVGDSFTPVLSTQITMRGVIDKSP